MDEEEQQKAHEEYLDFMYEYERVNNHYPAHISNGQWVPYSFTEWKQKTEQYK